MERLLHYVWKYKLYASTSLATTEGLPIAVIDPGIQNTDAGPRDDAGKSFRLVAASSRFG